MSGRTFYLAAASSNVEQARARIADLESMGWRCNYDWTGLDQPESEWPGVAATEIGCALVSDLFVALAPVSPGVACEMGARLSRVSGVHLVGEWIDERTGKPHVFALHPFVRRHESWDAFVAALSGGER